MPPHIVYILADNIGYGGLGYLRARTPAGPSPEIATPHIDALAKDGVTLERLYTYEMCSPSRSSLLSGRLPQHVNIHNDEQTKPGAGIPAAMATIPSKLREMGYRTHQIGKWHVGFSTPQHTPLGRGFVTSLGYIAGAYNGYLHGWSQYGATPPHTPKPKPGACYPGRVRYPSDANGTLPGPNEHARCTASSVLARHLGHTTDLWETYPNGTDGPAIGLNTSMDGHGYEEELFTMRALSIINTHAEEAKAAGMAGAPLFLYYAMHLLHSPLCAPPELLDRFGFIEHVDRRYASAMAAFMDESVGRVVSALKAAPDNMWESTLLIWSSDNGAAIEEVTGAKSAYPLKGGYYTNWEGGVRAPGVVGGGYLPSTVRGTSVHGFVHLCDWLATFCALAGCDTSDEEAEKAGLPPMDSLNMWPMLSGKNTTSPRTEVWLTPLSGDRFNASNPRSGDAALIVGQHKLIVGNISQSSWCGATYPNLTTPWVTWDTIEQCTTSEKVGCLFDVFDDPSEHHDLALEQPELAAKLLKRLEVLDTTLFDPPRGDADYKGACVAVRRNGGTWGPWLSGQLK